MPSTQDEQVQLSDVDLRQAQETIKELMEAGRAIGELNEKLKPLREKEKQCRQAMRQFMVKHEIDALDRDDKTIALYNASSQPTMNKDLLKDALVAYVKEHGNRLEPGAVVDYVVAYRKQQSTKSQKLTVRTKPAPKESAGPTKRKAVVAAASAAPATAGSSPTKQAKKTPGSSAGSSKGFGGML